MKFVFGMWMPLVVWVPLLVVSKGVGTGLPVWISSWTLWMNLSIYIRFWMVEYTCIVSMNSFKILITWVPSQDINTPLGFLRHLMTILRMGPGGLFSAAVVCSSWTVVNSSWAYSYLERVVYCASIETITDNKTTPPHSPWCLAFPPAGSSRRPCCLRRYKRANNGTPYGQSVAGW